MQGSNRTADEDDQHRCDPVPAPLGDVRSVSLLPEFELSCAGATVPVANSSRRLLAFRARHDKPVRRSFASGSLWPHATEQRASACLRTAIWRAPAPRDKPPVTVSATHVGLDPGVRVDYREIVAQAAALLDGHPSPGSGQAQAGPDVPGHPGPSNPGPSNPGPSNPGLSDRPSPLDNPGPWALLMSAPGELLPGWYDEWVTVERERYRQLRLHALEEVCDRLLRHGQYPQALMVVLAAVSGEPSGKARTVSSCAPTWARATSQRRSVTTTITLPCSEPSSASRPPTKWWPWWPSGCPGGPLRPRGRAVRGSVPGPRRRRRWCPEVCRSRCWKRCNACPSWPAAARRSCARSPTWAST